MAKLQPKIKRSRRVKRPPSVGFSDLVPASRSGRLGAFSVDVALMISILIIGVIATPIGSAVLGLIYVALRDLARGSGRSLGRSMSGQRLLDENGELLSPGKTVGRNLVRLLLWMTILPFFIDLAMVLFGNGRLIADHIFDSRVYEDPESVRKKRALEKGTSRHQSVHEESDEDDLIERESVEEIAFESPDYNQRQLDDFESRLSGSSTSLSAIEDEADLLNDFELRLNSAASAAEDPSLSLEQKLGLEEAPVDSPGLFEEEEVVVPEEESVSAS